MAEAGWYPDPGEQHELRWFDGSGWTDEVMTRPRPAVAAASSPSTEVGPSPATEVGPSPDQDDAGSPTRFPAVPAAGWKLLLVFGGLLTGAVLLPFASAGGDASAIVSDPSAALPIFALVGVAIVAGLLGRAGYDVGPALGTGVVLVFSVVMALFAPFIKLLFDFSSAYGTSVEPNAGIICLAAATVVGLIVAVPVVASVARTEGKAQLPPVLGIVAAGGAALYLWGVTRPAYPGAPLLTGDWYFDSVLVLLFASVAVPALLVLGARTASAAALLGGALVFPGASWFAEAVGSGETFGVQRSAGYDEMGFGLMVALVAVVVGVFSGAQRAEQTPEGVRHVPARSSGAMAVVIGVVLLLGLVAMTESADGYPSGYDTGYTDFSGD